MTEQEFYYYLLLVVNYTIFTLGTFYLDMYTNITKIGIKDKNEILMLYKKYIPRVAFNLYLASIPFIIFTFRYLSVPSTNPEYSLRIPNIIGELLVTKYLTDISFYTTHKILHYPPLYEMFHKKHHEVKNPISIAALYTTVGDMYFANLIPLAWTPLLVITSKFTYDLWIVLSIFMTVSVAHSGFKKLSEFHDIHHKYFKYNYGNGLFMDKLCKTLYLYKEDELLALKKKEALDKYTQTEKIKSNFILETFEEYIARKL